MKGIYFWSIEYKYCYMRILICDKDKGIQKQLKNSLKKIYKELVSNENIFVLTFGNAFELGDHLDTKHIVADVIFMDITLIDENDRAIIDVAKNIKTEHTDTTIVLYTGSPEYVELLYEIEPFRIIVKPINDEKLANVLKKLVKLLDKEKYITVKKIGEIRRIRIKDVCFIESQGKYIKIHTDDECIATINKLDNMKQHLGEEFVFCHKSYLVNINKVKSFDYTKLTLFDNTEILISRTYKAKIKDIFLNELKG